MKRIGSFVAPAIIAALFVLAAAASLVHANEPRDLHGSATKDWASLVDGAGASQDVTVSGAVLGDFCIASMSVDVVDMLMTCNVTAANVATVRMQNETTGTVDLASGTLRIAVIRRALF